jgi:site-specific DNA-methyltransferase (adenine-specific)
MSRVEQIAEGVTLYLGDCREIMRGALAIDVLITDPPYGVNLGTHLASKDRRADRVLVKDGYASYDDTPENYRAVVVPAIDAALKITKDGRGLVFGVPPAIWQLPAPTAMGGVYLPAACGRNTWGFSSFVHALLYGRAPNLHLGAKHTAIESTEAAEKNGHPCPKPLSWMMWAVALASTPAETVFDPFMGSGTTGAAAVQLGRRFVGVELEPTYFDLSCVTIEKALKQKDLFIEKPTPAKQLGLLDAAE